MAAVLVETLVPTAGDALQAMLADWASYVVSAETAYTVAYNSAQNRRYIENVRTDAVNVTTRRYYINDIGAGTFHSIGYICGQPGVADLSPPILQPTYGARNTLTDFTNNFWANIKLINTNWMNCGRLDPATVAITAQPTGFVQTQFSALYQANGQIGVILGRLTTRDPATATIAASGVFPSAGATRVPTLSTPASASEATTQRIATALEALLLKGRDFSFNSGNIHVSSNGSVVGP